MNKRRLQRRAVVATPVAYDDSGSRRGTSWMNREPSGILGEHAGYSQSPTHTAGPLDGRWYADERHRRQRTARGGARRPMHAKGGTRKLPEVAG